MVQTRIQMKTTEHIKLKLSICIMAIFMTAAQGIEGANKSQPSHTTWGNDDTEFTFMGKCPNGQPYHIFAYSKWVDGREESYYDFEGPAGQGTVRTSATPRTMSVRICRKLAEIIDEY